MPITRAPPPKRSRGAGGADGIVCAGLAETLMRKLGSRQLRRAYAPGDANPPFTPPDRDDADEMRRVSKRRCGLRCERWQGGGAEGGH